MIALQMIAAAMLVLGSVLVVRMLLILDRPALPRPQPRLTAAPQRQRRRQPVPERRAA